MKLRTGPATPDELAELLTLRLALEWDEWPSDRVRAAVLEWLRVGELKRRRRRKSDYEKQWVAKKREKGRDAG